MMENLSSQELRKTEKLFSLLSDKHKQTKDINTIEDLALLAHDRVNEHRGSLTYTGALGYVAQEIDTVVWAEFVGYRKGENEVLKVEKAEIVEIDEIDDLDANTKVSVKGYVQSITPPTQYTAGKGSNQYTSFRAPIQLTDGENTIRFVLWGKPCNKINRYAKALRQGNEILIENAVVRDNEVKGKVYKEIHYTKGTDIDFNAGKTKKTFRKKFLTTSFTATSMKRKDGEIIDAQGKLTNVYPPKDFTRRDGSAGQVQNIQIADEKGNALRISVWNPDLNLTIPLGSEVYLSNFKAKENSYSNKVELSSQYDSFLELTSDPPLLSINDALQSKDYAAFSVSGTITNISEITTFSRSSGEDGRVQRIKLTDTGKSIMIVLWDEKIEDFDHEVNTVITVTNVSARKKESGIVEGHATTFSEFIEGKKKAKKKKKATTKVVESEETEEVEITTTGALLNVLKGLTVVLFNSCLMANGVTEVRENVFFDWVKDYMIQNGLDEIPIENLKESVDSIITDGRLERIDGHLQWAEE